MCFYCRCVIGFMYKKNVRICSGCKREISDLTFIRKIFGKK
jgi:hypothetical protein